MAEYITKDAVISLFEKWSDGYAYIEIPVRDAIRQVSAIPPADVWPVVRGRWVYDCERTMGDGWTYRQYHCSVCSSQDIGGLHNFCPHCGSDMREGDAE